METFYHTKKLDEAPDAWKSWKQTLIDIRGP